MASATTGSSRPSWSPMSARSSALPRSLSLAVAVALAVWLAPPASARASQLCQQFDQQVIEKGKNWSLMSDLIRAKNGGDANAGFRSMNDRTARAWTQRLEGYKALFATLKPICAKPELMEGLQSCKPTHGKPRLQGLYAEKDPVVWCMVAEDGPDLVRGQVLAHMARADAIAARRYESEIGEVERGGGWFADDRGRG